MARYNVELFSEKRRYRVSMEVKGENLKEALAGVTMQIFAKTRRKGQLSHFDKKEVLMTFCLDQITDIEGL